MKDVLENPRTTALGNTHVYLHKINYNHETQEEQVFAQ